jgi:lipoprotein-anchoring transpeptidase ErfK/SrfK
MSLFDRRTLILSGAAAFAAGSAVAAYQVPSHLHPRIVDIKDSFRPNEIHVDPGQFALYWTLPEGKAIRYSVGIGKAGRYRSGTFRIRRKAEWPSWTPTSDMIERSPASYAQYANGMAGGINNPLGARALYLFSGNRDTFLRIHGTNAPRTIGSAVYCDKQISLGSIDDD